MTAHNTRTCCAHACGFSIGPIECLSSWWPSDRSYPNCQQQPVCVTYIGCVKTGRWTETTVERKLMYWHRNNLAFGPGFTAPRVSELFLYLLSTYLQSACCFRRQGALVSACADDQLCLWTLRQKTPEIVHSLKFHRERQVTSSLRIDCDVFLSLFVCNGTGWPVVPVPPMLFCCEW